MKKLFVLVLGICAGGALSAHQWFAALLDAKAYQESDMVRLGVFSTHHFMVGENVQDASRNAFFVLLNNKSTDISVRPKRDDAQKILAAEFTLPANGAVMALVNSVGVFSHTTSSGIRGGTKETLKALGFTVLKTTMRESWCKVYVNPSAQDVSFSQALGLPLEIVPVTNPAAIAVGKPAVFKVLYGGKPLAGANIYATYKSFNSKDEEAWAIKDVKTGKDGAATLDIPNAAGAKDIWVVKTEYAGDVPKTAGWDAAAYNCWASFVVRN